MTPTSGRRARARSRASAVVGLVAMVTLTGCVSLSSPKDDYPQRSAASAAADILAVRDVETSRVDQVFSGTIPYIVVDVVIAKDSDLDDAQLAQVADYALAQVWSQTEFEPGTVSIKLTQTDETVNAPGILRSLGIASIRYPSKSRGILPKTLEKRFGPWPGAVPPLPETLQ